MSTYLLSLLLQCTLLMLVGIVVSRLFLRRATIRHGILFGTLLCVIASPLLLWACATLNLTFAEIRIPVAQDSSPSALAAPGESLSAREEPNAVETASVAGESTRSPNFGATHSPPNLTGRSNWLAIAGRCGVGIWLMGAMALSWGVLRSWWKLRQVRRLVVPIDAAELDAVVVELRRALNMRVLPPVVESLQVYGPIATGLRQPLIILPDGLCHRLTSLQLRDVLIHEVAHIARLDDLVVLLQAAARVVLWPHPLIHLLNRELAAAREDICDNFVLAHSDTVTFAETLLELAQLVKASPAMPATAGLFPVRGKLETRVSSLLDERRSTSKRLGRVASIFVALGVFVMAVAAGTTRVALSGDAMEIDPRQDALVETIRSRNVETHVSPVLPTEDADFELSASTTVAAPLSDVSSPTASDHNVVGVQQWVEQLQVTGRRDAAIATLSTLGPAAERDVLAALESTNYEVRMAAYKILESVGTRTSLETIERLYLQRSGREQSAAKSTLDAIWQRLGDSAVGQQPSARSIRHFQ